MPTEYSAGAIIYRKETGRIFYLLLHYEEGHWGSAKGHIENKETLEETARREIQEETGLTDIQIIPGFKEENRYFFFSNGQRIFKTVTFFLAETFTNKIKLSTEHIGFDWLPYQEAIEKITFKDEKKVLQRASEFIDGDKLSFRG